MWTIVLDWAIRLLKILAEWECEEIAMHKYIYNKYMQLTITAAISSHL